MREGRALSLPKGWEIKKLGEICKFENGDRGKNYPSRKHRVEIGIPFINAGHIQSRRILKKNMDYITRERYDLLGNGKVRNNDIIFCLRGSLGKFARIEGFAEGAIASSLVIVRVGEEIITEYLMYYFESDITANMISMFSNGAAQPNLSANSLKKFDIPLPSLSEQKRIVAKLDNAFDAIDQAKANAEKNLQNAQEMFESYLNGVFDPSTRSGSEGDDWEEKRLGDITNKIGSGATPKGGKANYKEVGISLIRSMNVHDLQFKEKNLAYIDDQQAAGLANVEISKNDVLLNITGASIARCCVVPTHILPARVNQHVSIIRSDKDSVYPQFLVLLLVSKHYKDKILGIGEQGATRQAITKVQIEELKILLPKTIEEQKQIVQKLASLSAECKKMEMIYQQKIKDLEELKKSLLEKAFNGEL